VFEISHMFPRLGWIDSHSGLRDGVIMPYHGLGSAYESVSVYSTSQ